MTKDYEHYFIDVKDLDTIDIYMILRLYHVTDPAVAHAIKKLLCMGGRGAKDTEQDLKEAADALKRKMEIDAKLNQRTPAHARYTNEGK